LAGRAGAPAGDRTFNTRLANSGSSFAAVGKPGNMLRTHAESSDISINPSPLMLEPVG